MPLPGRIQFSEDSLRRISSIPFTGRTGASYAAPLEVRRVSCVTRVAPVRVTVLRAASVLDACGSHLTSCAWWARATNLEHPVCWENRSVLRRTACSAACLVCHARRACESDGIACSVGAGTRGGHPTPCAWWAHTGAPSCAESCCCAWRRSGTALGIPSLRGVSAVIQVERRSVQAILPCPSPLGMQAHPVGVLPVREPSLGEPLPALQSLCDCSSGTTTALCAQ